MLSYRHIEKKKAENPYFEEKEVKICKVQTEGLRTTTKKVRYDPMDQEQYFYWRQIRVKKI